MRGVKPDLRREFVRGSYTRTRVNRDPYPTTDLGICCSRLQRGKVLTGTLAVL